MHGHTLTVCTGALLGALADAPAAAAQADSNAVVAERAARATATPDAAAPDATSPRRPDVVCASKPGERQTCAAETRRGVTLLHATGDVACELGRTWGYDTRSIWVADGCSAAFAVGAQPAADPELGSYPVDGGGFRIADTRKGTVNLKLWAYVRYLNQRGLDETYVDALGESRQLRPRDDLQFQKVNLQAAGWFMTERLRYLAYVWTANVSQGLGAQVVVAGNLNYTFDDAFTLGGGIGGLPGVRSTEGTFPYFLTLDNRLIADGFFQPSYTTGIWAKGRFARKFTYFAMLGNNLSQLGVDAGQLRGGMDTFSAVVAWMPTTGEFGPLSGFGDWEEHEQAATRLGVHFTRSDENRQNQPDTEAPENSQIRLSNGGVVFTPGVFGEGVAVTDVHYQMADFDAGVKWRGFSLEGEYYWRWLSDFRGVETAGIPNQFDHGIGVFASAMPIRKTLQAYVGASKVFGEYGDPSDFRFGVNWYPMRNRTLMWNVEWIDLRRSPIGALSLPYVVGGNGSLFHINFQLNI